MGLKGPDPMETLVGLALRVLVAAVVLGVAFQVCELMGHKESDMTERTNCTELINFIIYGFCSILSSFF